MSPEVWNLSIGKTETAQQVVEAQPDLTVINIGLLVSEQGLHDGWDDVFESYFINEDKVRHKPSIVPNDFSSNS